MYFLLKTIIYISSMFPNIVEVSKGEQYCHCASIPILISRGFYFSCTKKNNASSECQEFFFRINSCLDCIKNWNENKLLLSYLRIFLSSFFLIRGNYSISSIILSTSFVDLPELVSYFERNFYDN